MQHPQYGLLLSTFVLIAHPTEVHINWSDQCINTISLSAPQVNSTMMWRDGVHVSSRRSNNTWRPMDRGKMNQSTGPPVWGLIWAGNSIGKLSGRMSGKSRLSSKIDARGARRYQEKFEGTLHLAHVAMQDYRSREPQKLRISQTSVVYCMLTEPSLRVSNPTRNQLTGSLRNDREQENGQSPETYTTVCPALMNSSLHCYHKVQYSEKEWGIVKDRLQIRK